MIRMQIQLNDEQMARLRRHAAERQVSVAALIREAVDQQVPDDGAVTRRARALKAVKGAHFRSGLTDVSERHDTYLAEDFT